MVRPDDDFKRGAPPPPPGQLPNTPPSTPPPVPTKKPPPQPPPVPLPVRPPNLNEMQGAPPYHIVTAVPARQRYERPQIFAPEAVPEIPGIEVDASHTYYQLAFIVLVGLGLLTLMRART